MVMPQETGSRRTDNGMVVLIIGNKAKVRKQLARDLRGRGYQVEELTNPDDAKRLEATDAVIAREWLPHEDAVAFADRFHREQPFAPVLLTACGWSEHLALEVGRRKFLWLRQEPIDVDEIDSLLAHSKSSLKRTAAEDRATKRR